jgi:peptidoglycan/LPS O-acetylase OafA/YrhL
VPELAFAMPLVTILLVVISSMTYLLIEKPGIDVGRNMYARVFARESLKKMEKMR